MTVCTVPLPALHARLHLDSSVLKSPIPFLQDLCGGNVMLAMSSTSPQGFTANVGCQPLCFVLT
jgi:hypothetical protein